MVLTYLDTLDSVYSSTRPQIMGSSAVSSLLKTSFFEDCHSWGDIWHYYYNNLRSICLRSSGEADRWWPCWHEEMRGLHWWMFWWPRWYQGRTRRYSKRTRRWLY